MPSAGSEILSATVGGSGAEVDGSPEEVSGGDMRGVVSSGFEVSERVPERVPGRG